MRTSSIAVALPRVTLHRALTLVEALVSVVIVGTMLAAAIALVGGAAQARLIQAEQASRTALAEELMTEILQCRYAEPGLVEPQTLDDGRGGIQQIGDFPDYDTVPTFGPEDGEVDGTRANFDDVDDYYSWVASPPQAKDGTPYADHIGWTRQVALSFVCPDDPEDISTSGDQGLKRVTVKVIDPQGKETTLVALRSSFSSNEQFPDETVTFVDWVGFDLQISQAPRSRLQTGINIRDRVIVATGGPCAGEHLLGAPFTGE